MHFDLSLILNPLIPPEDRIKTVAKSLSQIDCREMCAVAGIDHFQSVEHRRCTSEHYFAILFGDNPLPSCI